MVENEPGSRVGQLWLITVWWEDHQVHRWIVNYIREEKEERSRMSLMSVDEFCRSWDAGKIGVICRQDGQRNAGSYKSDLPARQRCDEEGDLMSRDQRLSQPRSVLQRRVFPASSLQSRRASLKRSTPCWSCGHRMSSEPQAQACRLTGRGGPSRFLGTLRRWGRRLLPRGQPPQPWSGLTRAEPGEGDCQSTESSLILWVNTGVSYMIFKNRNTRTQDPLMAGITRSYSQLMEET